MGGDFYQSIEYPTGACVADGDESYMMECDGSNAANRTTWSNRDCSGDINYTIPIEDWFAELISDVTVEIKCCTGNPCRYGKVIEYFTLDPDCEQNITESSGSEELFIIGGCHGVSIQGYVGSTAYPVCGNGQLIEERYIGNLDCSGPPSITEVINDGHCSDWGELTRVECGISMDTCSFSGIVCLEFRFKFLLL